MKQLTEQDIAQMGENKFTPDVRATMRAVRAELRLNNLVPPESAPVPDRIVLDLHNYTVEQAWDAIMSVATSGTRSATIITGASGVLRQLFPGWVAESVLSPYIISAIPINNGSFAVKFHKHKN